MEIFLTSIANYVTGLSLNNPKLVGLLAILYTIGLVLKCLISAYKEYVKGTPSVEDDAQLEKIEQSQLGKAVYFVLDLLIRFKKV